MRGDSRDPVRQVSLRQGTLPPPEWAAPRSVSGLALDWLAEKAPVSRRWGARAELAMLEAALETARSENTEAERELSARLARALVAKGMELDRATKLARRALMLGEDPLLRDELSLWFAALGEAGLAAATLRPLEESTQGFVLAKVLYRIATFAGRMGQAESAADALARAADADPRDPVPLELLGAMGGWDADAVSTERAAAAYLEGSLRRDASGDVAGGFEDLLRAFDAAPQSPQAALRLSASLGSRGRAGAADEVLRASAGPRGTPGRAVHRDRMRDALADEDWGRALGAALDADADVEVRLEALLRAADQAANSESATPEGFDGLLARVHLEDVLAARLELVSDDLTGAARAEALVALGRLHAGPLGNPERATEAWIDALVHDPSSELAKVVLRDHAAATGDPAPIVEALIRIEALEGVEPKAKQDRLHELMILAEQKLGDPLLATWAAERLLGHFGSDDAAHALIERLAPRAAALQAEIEAARAADAPTGDAGRIEYLVHLVNLLGSRPAEGHALATVLAELVQVLPGERRYRTQLVRVLSRLGDTAHIRAVCERAIATGPATSADAARVRLATISRRAGDLEAAYAVLEPALLENSLQRSSWCAAFALAVRFGNRSMRARAIDRLSRTLPSAVAPALASVAAEELLECGLQDEARAAAAAATHAAPSSPRAMVALSRTLLGQRDRTAALVLERVMGVVVPRSHLCRELAHVLEALGDSEAALAWTQRWLVLRPGDPAAATALLRRVIAGSDATRLASALGWLLAQPQPLGDFAPLIGQAVTRLTELDPERGVAAARRVVDVFGPRIGSLRDVVLAVADATAEGALAVALLERELASGAPGSERGDMLLELARRRRALGQADAVAMTLVRSLVEGAAPAAVAAELQMSTGVLTGDGELALLRARAEVASATSSTDMLVAADAWRQYGAALWDMAGDHRRALEAWEHAASLDREGGMERLARDLVAFAGHGDAVARLESLARSKSEPRAIASVLACAAAVALDGRMRARALEIGQLALESDPSRADVLAVMESAAGPADVDALERAYVRVAEGALGIYGTRAAHYRAARQLERRADRSRALRHAIAAFEAVPAEGVTFVLMMRLAERIGDATEAVDAIDRVASSAENPVERAAWLRRAALIAGNSNEGKRQRVDVLLRALEATPDRDTVRSLGRAFADLVRIAPDERDVAEMRFRRAIERTLERMDGPEGARAGVDAARAALEAFDAADIAFSSLTRATKVDASIDEYAGLIDRAPRLGRDRENALAFMEHVAELAGAPYSNVGEPLCDLSLAIGKVIGDTRIGARILVAHAERNAGDVALVRRAQLAAESARDDDLRRRIAFAIPGEQRAGELIASGEAAERRQNDREAIDAYEQMRTLDGARPDQHAQAIARLEKLYAKTRRFKELEELLVDRLTSGETTPEQRVHYMIELARTLVARSRTAEARDVLTPLLASHPGDIVLLDSIFALACEVDDLAWQIQILEHRIPLETSAAGRLALLRRLAPLCEKIGDSAGAVSTYERILELDAADVVALAALERDAERHEDYHNLVELLDHHARIMPSPEDARRLGLRRAELLETKLGRPDEARQVLGELLASGEQPEVLEKLADIHHRLGELGRAAPLWLRASRVAKAAKDRSDLARKACRAFLDGGDVERARIALDELAKLPSSSGTFALRVDVERRSENPKGLCDALEGLALASMDPAPKRAGLLVEAARAALQAGDPGRALGQAQRAARIAPEAAEPQLFARRLEYVQRTGAGNVDEARVTVNELGGIRGQLTPAETELRAFLLADALDVARGPGEGMRPLAEAHAELGETALIALGMAERLAVTDPERALMFFDVALAGDLQGLRNPGEVAIRAALAARRAEARDRALAYLDRAASLSSTRARALELQADFRAELARASEPGGTVTAESAPVVQAPRRESGTILISAAPPKPGVPAPAVKTTVNVSSSVVPDAPTQREPAIPLMRPRMPSASPPAEAGALRSIAPAKPREVGPAVPSAITLVHGSPDVGEVAAPQPTTTVPAVPRELVPISMAPSTTPVPSQFAGAQRGRLSMLPSFPEQGEDEAALVRALELGSTDAGKELIRLLGDDPKRIQDLVRVCRRLASLLPGDLAVLERLHTAALADGNRTYAEALQHVLHSFDPSAEPVEPPPLVEQLEQAERVRALLLRDATRPVTEALGLVWASAQHVFRRDPRSYGVTGMERIPASSPIPVGRLFAAATALLGLGATPLFIQKGTGAPRLEVALLQPPALLVDGDIGEPSPAFAFRLGAALAGTMPEYVLCIGGTEQLLGNVLAALQVAFGPPQAHRKQLGEVATLAGMLWETVPARAQRRLSELCDDPAQLALDAALAAARQIGRRYGLFVSGDLLAAVRETCHDLAIPSSGLDAPGALATLCASTPAVADLVRLATSAEFADARWRRMSGRHHGAPWSRF